ncbi:hypothetical protein [Sagittula salina]|nr:hypothetical protein [Sagittula salina]
MKNTAGLFRKSNEADGARRDGGVRARAMPRLTTADFAKMGLLLVLVAMLAGCGLGKGVRREQAQTFDGQTFRGTAKPVGDDRTQFVASVSQPGKSIDGAIKAAAYQGTKYCIRTYGTSDIDWSVGPDTPKDQLTITSDALMLTGQCRDR